MADDWFGEKPSAPDMASSHDADDQLNAAGNKIVNLLQQAASISESKTRDATDHAERLSRQLQAAESRIGDLEAEVRYYQERANRAEEWLHRIYSETEARFPLHSKRDRSAH
jgi:DNA repair ATPase RecN